MRELNSFVLQKIKEDVLKTYTLIYIDFVDNPVYLTTLPYDVEFDGNIYLKDAGVLDYTNPVQSASVDRQNFSITFADNLSAFKNLTSISNAGRDAKMYLGFFNTDGTPNTDPENVVVTYEGFVDNTTYNNDFEEALYTVGLSSPMADLSLVNTLTTSPDGMDRINLLDTSFDKVLLDNEEIIKWGKT